MCISAPIWNISFGEKEKIFFFEKSLGIFPLVGILSKANKDGEYLKKFSSLIDWAHKNKLEFHITEHNIQIMNDVELDEDTITSVYANIVRTLLQKRKTGVVAWNLWDLTDKPHHRVPGLMNIGLWKKDYTPRKAYYSVQEVLEREGSSKVKN